MHVRAGIALPGMEKPPGCGFCRTIRFMTIRLRDRSTAVVLVTLFAGPETAQ